MKATQKYDKRQIMTRAWYFYRHRCCCSFAECLKDAWKMAKEAAIERERQAARTAEYKTKYGKRDNYYANLYRGRNEWQVSYGRRYAHF